MSFLEKLEDNLLEDWNVSVTENGAVGYKTTGKPLLDMNFKISSYRNMTETEIVNDFKRCFLQDNVLALQFLFFIRDREEGLGERRTFRVILKALASAYPGYVARLIPIVGEYGRYDDLLPLLDTREREDVATYLTETMISDFKKMEENKPISLLAKWLPSINTSNKDQRRYANILISKLQQKDKTFNAARYRKALSKMRTYLDVVEKKMCAKDWDKIKYETVPSKANLIYRDAFLRHDYERRTNYLESLKKGETKINAKKLFPYEIYKSINSENSCDETLQQLWNNLPPIKNDTESVLVVADGSGSMDWEKLGNTKVTALDVANSLAIYFAERAKGEFRNTYITFSSNPQLVHFKEGASLYNKKQTALLHNECSNTNIEKTFDLILDTAIKNNMAQEDMPSTLLILSDMEFDEATYDFGYYLNSNTQQKLFKTIDNKFKEAGYKMPRLVFWNICGRTNTIPVKENEAGVALVSGFSTTIFDMVLNNETDPYEMLLKKLNTPRYLKIKELVEN